MLLRPKSATLAVTIIPVSLAVGVAAPGTPVSWRVAALPLEPWALEAVVQFGTNLRRPQFFYLGGSATIDPRETHGGVGDTDRMSIC